MRVISISIDTKMLDKNSAVFRRMLEYAKLVDSLDIICYSPNKNYPTVTENNLAVYPTNSSSKISFIKDAYGIAKNIIQKINFDPKETIVTTQDPFETGIVGYLLKKKFNIGLNVQDHGGFFEAEEFFRKESFLNKLRLFVGKLIIKQADSVRTVSIREKLYIENKFKYDPEKIVNLPIFTDWKKFSQSKINFDIKQKYSTFQHHIITACRLEKVKNIPLLIQSFSEIIQEFPKTLLIIIGSGSEEKNISKTIIKNNLHNNIIMKKWTDDLPSYYKTADFFVSSSFSEGWGLTTIEASACQCPVIITDTGCANEVIKNNYSGLIVPVNDKASLVKAMKRLISSKKERARLGENALKEISKLHTNEDTLHKAIKNWQKAIIL